MDFAQELARVLPLDIPNRDTLVHKAARHLALIVAANDSMNLTRITNPQEAAIKHVFDSVAPWRYFCKAKRVLDVGTGAGFPGIPLSIVMPGTHFTLCESVHKKARFVDAAVEDLELQNVRVIAERAEDHLSSRPCDVITARAVAPMSRLIPLFRTAFKNHCQLLLYKGPDVESEFEEAFEVLKKARVEAKVLHRYELPDHLGARTIVSISAQS